MTLILNGTDNSATTPAVTGTDIDTGIYYPAANQVAIATAGTQAMLVDSSQNVTFAGTLTSTGYANIPNNFGFKNRIINGDIRFWQRGTSGTSVAVGTYGPDRWRVGGGNALTLTQSTTFGTPYSLLIQATGTNHAVGQRIEALNIQDLAGQTVTLSYKIRADNPGTHKLLMYYAGTTNDFSAEVNFVNASISYTSNTVTTITYTVTLPANAANGLDIVFQWYNGGASINLTAFIWNVQLEAGPNATSFDYRSYGTELALCQRYFEKSFAVETAPANGVYSMGYISYVCFADQWVLAAPTILFKVNKRASPTIAFFGTTTNTWQLNDNNNAWQNQAATGTGFQGAIGTFTTGFSAGVHNNGNSGFAIGTARMIRGDWTASAEL